MIARKTYPPGEPHDRARSDLPVAMRCTHLRALEALERDLTGLRANAATEPVCVRRARQCIAEHLTEPRTAGMVAKHVGLCPQQFSSNSSARPAGRLAGI